MSFIFAPKRRTQASRGYTLAELAVVLAVVSVIVGAIWNIAGQAWESVRQQQLKEALYTVVKNTRAAYAGQAGISNNFSLTMPFLFNARAIPGTMRRPGCTNCADHPWGGGQANGSFLVCGWNYGSAVNCTNSTGTSPFFAIELRGLSLRSCINAAVRNSGADAPPGLVDVYINSVSILTGAGVTNRSLPVSVGDARLLCQANLTANSRLIFVYRMTAPTS